MKSSSVEDVMGYDVDISGLTGCVKEMTEWIDKGNHFRWMSCINPYSYVVSLEDKMFSQSLRDADWLIPDGIGIVIASQFLKGGIRVRVTGADVFFALQDQLNRAGGHSIFFLGSTEETLEAISARMKNDYPNLRLGGTYSPPYKPDFSQEDTDAMVAAVNASGADVLWVGMTAPKQEKWIFQNRQRLNVKFAGAFGAVFDFYTGRVKRAHPVFRKWGLEWLVRLVREPRRLWRRYLVSSPLFFWHLFLVMLWGPKSRD